MLNKLINHTTHFNIFFQLFNLFDFIFICLKLIRIYNFI